MTAPEAVRKLIPHAYGWSKPHFAFIERGTVFYRTRALSNAGGSSHTILFPVNIDGKTLSADEQWENLAGDATPAVENKTTRRDGFTASH